MTQRHAGGKLCILHVHISIRMHSTRSLGGDMKRDSEGVLVLDVDNNEVFANGLGQDKLIADSCLPGWGRRVFSNLREWGGR
jgi:hypothetical protein